MEILITALLLTSINAQAQPTQYELQQQLAQQQEILASKPSTAFLGRNGEKRKKRIISKIERLEREIKESE